VLNYHLYLRFCLFDIGIVLRVLEYILCSLFFFFNFVLFLSLILFFLLFDLFLLFCWDFDVCINYKKILFIICKQLVLGLKKWVFIHLRDLDPIIHQFTCKLMVFVYLYLLFFLTRSFLYSKIYANFLTLYRI
jgi:hypothetical protein